MGQTGDQLGLWFLVHAQHVAVVVDFDDGEALDPFGGDVAHLDQCITIKRCQPGPIEGSQSGQGFQRVVVVGIDHQEWIVADKFTRRQHRVGRALRFVLNGE